MIVLKASGVTSVCIVGSGTTRSSIALNLAKGNIEVDLFDILDQVPERGFSLIQVDLDTLVENELSGKGGVPDPFAYLRRDEP